MLGFGLLRLMKQSAPRDFFDKRARTRFDWEVESSLNVPADPLTAAEQAGKQAKANDNSNFEQAAA